MNNSIKLTFKYNKYNLYIYVEYSSELLLYKHPLCLAVENNNIEIVELLLSNENTDVNCESILFYN